MPNEEKKGFKSVLLRVFGTTLGGILFVLFIAILVIVAINLFFGFLLGGTIIGCAKSMSDAKDEAFMHQVEYMGNYLSNIEKDKEGYSLIIQTEADGDSIKYELADENVIISGNNYQIDMLIVDDCRCFSLKYDETTITFDYDFMSNNSSEFVQIENIWANYNEDSERTYFGKSDVIYPFVYDNHLYILTNDSSNDFFGAHLTWEYHIPLVMYEYDLTTGEIYYLCHLPLSYERNTHSNALSYSSNNLYIKIDE